MKFQQALKNILQESKISQVISLWRSKTMPNNVNELIKRIGIVRDDKTGRPLTGTQVKLRMQQAGMKENDPLLKVIQSAAERTFTSYAGKEEYEKELQSRQKNIGLSIKGAEKRKQRPSFQQS